MRMSGLLQDAAIGRKLSEERQELEFLLAELAVSTNKAAHELNASLLDRVLQPL